MEPGGKALHGATLGILMLETRFPRVHGDVGNALTFPFPVQYRVVCGASPDKVVREDPRKLAEQFIEAGRDLIGLGCDGISTTCGFLTPLQRELANALSVPVATSSLMQIPMLQKMLPNGKRVGVITISRDSLSKAHLLAAGIVNPDTVPVVGTEQGREFSAAILEDRLTLDFDACRLDLLDAANELVTLHPDVGCIVLECTNMAPYAADIRKVTGLPTYSIYSFLCWFQMGLLPERFDNEADAHRR
ncbi:MAG: aspartate/glutamate racemase family protein [Roseibium sp.]